MDCEDEEQLQDDQVGASTPLNPTYSIRYGECLKNHAVSINRHTLDGCGEFIPAGDEGTLDALKCAACNCHRNFHRKETESAQTRTLFHPLPQTHHFSTCYISPPSNPASGYLCFTSPATHNRPMISGNGGVYSKEEGEDVSNPSSSGGSKKRCRTKFTQEQKEKMLGFAEKLGWRIQKHDDACVEQFCAEIGVKRQVLKVWMHNNKLTQIGERKIWKLEREHLYADFISVLLNADHELIY